MKIDEREKIIIDTDPGHDDALALLLTIKSKKFDVLAVTTVAGNAQIEKVTQNAQAIVNLTEEKIPIFSGQPTPLKRKLITAVVHGESGLDGFDTNQTKFALTNNAAKKIIELVEKFPGQITILALGPLTNLALALQNQPSIAKKIKRLVIMGGAIDVAGNKNRVSEFNFFVDPEAASIVMQSQIPKTLVPLDACNQVVMQVDDFKKISNQKLNKILLPMMEHFFAGLIKDEGTTGILVYDALAAFFLINPDSFVTEKMDILIETTGELTSGMCVVEKRDYKEKNFNVDVVTKTDGQIFIKNLIDVLSR
ncbi:nucleoside hydrolase [Patescibacteria group bacterium]|nr:nucleoside hydrolase [Patescibacteria group bacterium]